MFVHVCSCLFMFVCIYFFNLQTNLKIGSSDEDDYSSSPVSTPTVSRHSGVGKKTIKHE